MSNETRETMRAAVRPVVTVMSSVVVLGIAATAAVMGQIELAAAIAMSVGGPALTFYFHGRPQEKIDASIGEDTAVANAVRERLGLGGG